MIPKKYQLAGNTLASNVLEKLIEEPQTGINQSTGPGIRSMTRVLKNPGGCRHWKSIYYLHGDERRAIRKCIEVNEREVKKMMGSETNNTMSMNWQDPLYQIMCEEWQYHVRNSD